MYGVIHKGCPRLRERKGLAAMWTKVDRGKEGGRERFSAVSFKRGDGNQKLFHPNLPPLKIDY